MVGGNIGFGFLINNKTGLKSFKYSKILQHINKNYSWYQSFALDNRMHFNNINLILTLIEVICYTSTTTWS